MSKSKKRKTKKKRKKAKKKKGLPVNDKTSKTRPPKYKSMEEELATVKKTGFYYCCDLCKYNIDTRIQHIKHKWGQN